MNARMLVVTATVAMVTLTTVPAGAQFVSPGGIVPVVANNPGLGGTFWRSDVNILNTGDEDTTVYLMLFPELVNGVPAFELTLSDAFTVPAHGQRTLTNVVQSEFGLFDEKGALSVHSTNGAPLVVSSRVFTYATGQCSGSYGQNVSSVLVANEAWAAGIEHSGFYRTNLGIFLPSTPPEDNGVVFAVEVRDNTGEAVATGSLVFHDAGLQQVSLEEFGVGTLLDASLHITCSDPSMIWYAYTSTVDQSSGDAVFHTATGRQQDLP